MIKHKYNLCVVSVLLFISVTACSDQKKIESLELRNKELLESVNQLKAENKSLSEQLRQLSKSQVALAVPGKSLKEVSNWAKEHIVLSPLKLQQPLENEADYVSSGKTNGGKIEFGVWLEEDKTARMLEISYDSKFINLEFSKDDHQGLNLIKQLFNSAMSDDFKQAKPFDKVKWHNGTIYYFQGNRFAYSAYNYRMNNVTYATINIFKKDRLKFEIEVKKTSPFGPLRVY